MTMPEKIWAEKWKLLRVPVEEREIQLVNWLGRSYAQLVKGREVVDVGCGDGSNALIVLQAGARKVTLIDHDASILAAAKAKLAGYAGKTRFVKLNLETEQLGVSGKVVMCVGVLHHLTNRRKALENMWDAVLPGGSLRVWVYGDYSSGVLLMLLHLTRLLTSRMPFRLNKWLAHPLAAALRIMSYALPLPYLRQVRGFSYKHVYEIVLDQMIPKTAVYYSEKRLRNLLKGLPLSYAKDNNNAGWLISGEKSKRKASAAA